MPRLFPHHIFRWLLASTVALALLIWGGGVWAASRARTMVNERLAKRDLQLTCKSETWSPWRGVTLSDAVLTRVSGDHAPVASISTLHITVEWAAAWQARAPITRWQAKEATLVVHDEEGEVTLEHVTTDFTVRGSGVEVARLAARRGPAVFDLKGDITTAPRGGGHGGEFQLRLKPLRAVLNVFSFPSESKDFTMSGKFSLDARERPWRWTADLRGAGQDIIWRTVPLRQIASSGQLSNDGMVVTNEISFSHGSATLDIKREGWKQTPLLLTGTLKDSENRSDDFSGSYQTAERTLKIDRLEGRADLLKLMTNVPALADKAPRNVQVKTFPDIAARDLICTWNTPGEPPTWSLEHLHVRSPADLAVNVQKQPLKIDDLTGSASYGKGAWQLAQMKGKLLGGSFALSGSYDGKILSKADIDLHSLNISRLSPWAGKVNAKLDNSEMTLAYKGTICGREPVRSTGSGSMVLTNAPVVHIPILDQAYSLFPKLLPRKGSDGTGEVQLSFVMTKGVASVEPFKARSESVTVTAKGTVDLVRKRVDGTARANLRGLVGVVTSPLSHVLMDMEINGPLSDVRISPQGPVAAAKGAVKAAKGGAKFSSKAISTGLTLPFRALGMLDGED